MNRSFIENNKINYQDLQFGVKNQNQRIQTTNDLIKKYRNQINNKNFLPTMQILTNLKYINDLLKFIKFQNDLNLKLDEIWKTNVIEDDFYDIQNQKRTDLINETQFSKDVPIPDTNDLKQLLQKVFNSSNHFSYSINNPIGDNPKYVDVNCFSSFTMEQIKTSIQNLQSASEATKTIIKWNYMQKRIFEKYLKRLNQWYQSMYNAKYNPYVSYKPNKIKFKSKKLLITDDIDVIKNKIVLSAYEETLFG